MTGDSGKMVLHSPNHGDVVAIDWAEGGSSAPRLLYAFEKAEEGEAVSAGRTSDGKVKVVEMKAAEKKAEKGKVVSSAGRKGNSKLRAVEKTKGEKAAGGARPKARVYPKLVPGIVIGRKARKHGFEEGRAEHRKEEWGQTMKIKWHPHTW
jgi:hypothetical protein